MTAQAIREKLHNYLEVADDSKVEALYSLLTEQVEAAGRNYPDDLIKELDRRVAGYLDGSIKTITRAESKKRIDDVLKLKS